MRDQGVHRAQARQVGALPPDRAAARPDAAVRLRGDLRGLHVSTAVLDLDHSQESRDLISRFTFSSRFHIVKVAQSQREIDDAIDRSDAAVALVVHAGFAELLRKGQGAPLQVDRRRHQLQYRADRARLRQRRSPAHFARITSTDLGAAASTARSGAHAGPGRRSSSGPGSTPISTAAGSSCRA